MRLSLIFALKLMLVSSSYCQHQISEKDYSLYIQSLIGGEREVSIPSGRVDLVTKEYAFEIEKANKWKHSIGQSLWYALNTNRKPGIILILENSKDNKYMIQLNTALEYADLADKIQVFIFPKDFEELINATKGKKSR